MQLNQFMESHVWAVWDFQCLVKSIKHLCSHDNPYRWMPPRVNYTSLRFINQIILDEETDVLPNGEYASHLHMYIMSMEEVGADTSTIKTFLEKYNNSFLDINIKDIPQPARDFVKVTLDAIGTRKLHVILSVFAHGRELLIPDLFLKILQTNNIESPMFKYYLERHIEMDSEDHGPLALKMLNDVIGGDTQKQKEADLWKEKAIQARNDLWSALCVN